jgi:hypothetical protein
MADVQDPNTPAGQALDALVSLALRSENHEAVMPLAAEVRGGLPDPGVPPIQMTVVVYTDGRTRVNYLAEPGWAVATLRHLADTIEAEQEVI